MTSDWRKNTWVYETWKPGRLLVSSPHSPAQWSGTSGGRGWRGPAGYIQSLSVPWGWNQKCDIPFTHSVQMLHTAEKSSWNLSEIIAKSFVFLYMTWHIYICLAFPRTDDNKVWTMYEEQNMNLIPNIEIDVNWHLNTTRGSILNNLYKPDTVLNVSHC